MSFDGTTFRFDPNSPNYGICPDCQSDHTLPSFGTAKEGPRRVCLFCGFVEYFNNKEIARTAWRNREGYVRNKRALQERLLGESDQILFGHGGCHVFALALHRRYGYPLEIREDENGKISHVYCLRNGEGLDIRGTDLTKVYFFECYPGTSEPVNADDLESMFSGENWDGWRNGLWGETQWLTKAFQRAEWSLDRAEKSTEGPHYT